MLLNVVRDNTLLQIPAAAKRRGDIPAYSIRDCSVQIQKSIEIQNESSSWKKFQRYTHTTADVDAIIREHHNSESKVQNSSLWLGGHDALSYAGVISNPANTPRTQRGLTPDGIFLKIIFPSAFAGGLVRVRPTPVYLSHLWQKGNTIVPHGLNGGVDTGEMVVATISMVRQALEGSGWLFFPAFVNEPAPVPGRLLCLQLTELSPLVGRHIEWICSPIPEPSDLPPGWTDLPGHYDTVTDCVQEIIGIGVDVKIGKMTADLYLLEATGTEPPRFYLYNPISDNLYTITAPDTYDAILHKIRTEGFEGLERKIFET